MSHKIEAVVVHSGGMDSSICLAQAIESYGKDKVVSLGFNYKQRNMKELERAAFIADSWGVERVELDLSIMQLVTDNALVDAKQRIIHNSGSAPNTMVLGRNGLMLWVASLFAKRRGAAKVYTGVIEIEEANSGYRDCSRSYMDKLQEILRIDFADPEFEIVTPVVAMTKQETLEEAYRLGVLPFLLEHTITCYEGIDHLGCQDCPACKLRNQGIVDFLEKHPTRQLEGYESLRQ